MAESQLEGLANHTITIALARLATIAFVPFLAFIYTSIDDRLKDLQVEGKQYQMRMEAIYNQALLNKNNIEHQDRAITHIRTVIEMMERKHGRSNP